MFMASSARPPGKSAAVLIEMGLFPAKRRNATAEEKAMESTDAILRAEVLHTVASSDTDSISAQLVDMQNAVMEADAAVKRATANLEKIRREIASELKSSNALIHSAKTADDQADESAVIAKINENHITKWTVLIVLYFLTVSMVCALFVFLKIVAIGMPILFAGCSLLSGIIGYCKIEAASKKCIEMQVLSDVTSRGYRRTLSEQLEFQATIKRRSTFAESECRRTVAHLHEQKKAERDGIERSKELHAEAFLSGIPLDRDRGMRLRQP